METTLYLFLQRKNKTTLTHHIFSPNALSSHPFSSLTLILVVAHYHFFHILPLQQPLILPPIHKKSVEGD